MQALRTVAALYIDPRGPYPKMAGVDCWDEKRDARLFDGLCPVVAHPPCTHYGRLRHLAKREDSDCAPLAVAVARSNGGVIEHPASSKLWDICELPWPGEGFDRFGGHTVEVFQCEWGHACRKRTWLYLVRTDEPISPPYPGRKPTHWIGGGRGRNEYESRRIPAGIKAASSEISRRTPPLFAEHLVALARSAF